MVLCEKQENRLKKHSGNILCHRGVTPFLCPPFLSLTMMECSFKRWSSQKQPLIVFVDDDDDDKLIVKEAAQATSLPLQLKFFDLPASLIEYLDRCETHEEMPQLIVIDMYFAGLNALESVHKLKAHPACRTIPVIMLTGSSSPEDILDFYKAGGSAYVCKPVSFEEWDTLIRDMCHYWFNVVMLPQ